VRIVRWIIAIVAWLYSAAVVVDWLALRYVGESWWLTTIGLYLPHWFLLLPILALTIAIVLVGPGWLVLLEAVTAGIVLVPLMGLTIGVPALATPGTSHLRVLSFNVNGGSGSIQEIAAEIKAAEPDIVLLQGSGPAVNEAVLAELPGFHSYVSTQFLIATRFAIGGMYEPPRLSLNGVDRSPRFVGATLETPLGKLDVFSVHPISPRDAIDAVRGNGFLVDLQSGDLFDVDHDAIQENTDLRHLQAEAIATVAAASVNPVLIGGDTNLPNQSRIFAETLGRWTDGFDKVGRGFGYTFPVGKHFPWMRIDRILAGPELRFLDFSVGRGRGSDHHCVWADLERAPR
jgi:endonuclease/exonuclease/phosphatase (EEP) superfamily protein YafD